MSPRNLKEVWGLHPKKFEITWIRIFKLALKMNIRQQNSLTFSWLWESPSIFSDFLGKYSLTFRVLFQIPWLFQVFQISWHPEVCVWVAESIKTQVHISSPLGNRFSSCWGSLLRVLCCSTSSQESRGDQIDFCDQFSS